MRPNEVNENNSKVVAARLYPPKPKIFRYRFKVGDSVKISSERMAFSKGYRGNWSQELFTVSAALPTDPVTYELRDLMENDIKGRFYEAELQLAKRPEFYAVEKVIKTRKRGGKTQYFVKWQGYGPEFNSWTEDLSPI